MANIKVSQGHLAGSELFIDSENFLQDLTDADAMAVQGGEGAGLPQYLLYGQKFLEFGVNGFAINNIASVARNYSIAGGAAGAGGSAGGSAGGGAGGGAGGAGGAGGGTEEGGV